MNLKDVLAVGAIIAALSIGIAFNTERQVNSHLSAVSAALNQVNADDSGYDLHTDR